MTISKTKNNKAGEQVPLVSILCATFNHVDYIKDCLEGVLMQEVSFPIEIIVRDDASTDGTSDIVRHYEAKHPHLFRNIYESQNQYTKGVRPRTVMIKQARGKYIALCEGDDYWTDPYKLQKQIDFLENNSGYPMCFHDSMFLNQIIGYKCLRIGERTVDEDVDLKSLILENNIPTASMVYRNIKLIYTDEMLQLLKGDYLLCILLAEHGKLKCIRENMSVYREHAGGVWAGASRDLVISENLRFYHFLIKRYEDNRPELLPALFSKIRHTQFDNSLLLLRKRNYWQSIKTYFRVLSSKHREIPVNHKKYLEEFLKCLLHLKRE